MNSFFYFLKKCLIIYLFFIREMFTKKLENNLYIYKNTKFNMNYFNIMRINNKVNENIKRIRKEIRDK